MKATVQMMAVYVQDQDEALAFYVDRLGFVVHTDARNGDYRWLTVHRPEQPGFQLGLLRPGAPVHDANTAAALGALVSKGAMPALVLAVDDCKAACSELARRGVEITQQPVERYGTVDAGFRDPSGNGWKLIQERRS